MPGVGSRINSFYQVCLTKMRGSICEGFIRVVYIPVRQYPPISLGVTTKTPDSISRKAPSIVLVANSVVQVTLNVSSVPVHPKLSPISSFHPQQRGVFGFIIMEASFRAGFDAVPKSRQSARAQTLISFIPLELFSLSAQSSVPFIPLLFTLHAQIRFVSPTTTCKNIYIMPINMSNANAQIQYSIFIVCET